MQTEEFSLACSCLGTQSARVKSLDLPRSRRLATLSTTDNQHKPETVHSALSERYSSQLLAPIANKYPSLDGRFGELEGRKRLAPSLSLSSVSLEPAPYEI